MPLKLIGRINLDLWIIGFVALFLLLLALFDGDLMTARYFFFDVATNEWIARHDWWANELLHTGGRNLMRLVGVLALVAWAASYRSTRLATHRADLGYFAACMVLVPVTIGILKQITNVDCPWDLQGFGGGMPAMSWFESRPAELPRATCFPGAHSSSAFALFGLFFMWRSAKPAWATVALLGTLALGGAFSIAQQSRGAHFLSHDIVSALLAWLICLGLHRFRRRGVTTTS
ncbi:MAG: phosphatase PAP2 family protein [Gammaproteobacteria bacterium]|nr:phosphatase PAP2 family protein [Gammaproteobacteria bacterium]